MNENLNHQSQAPAPANGVWRLKNIAAVLAIVIASTSATAFVMSQDNKVRAENTAAIEKIAVMLVDFRNENAASIEKLNNTIVEFRLEMKDELGDIKREIIQIKNRLDTHEAKFIELEDKIEEVAKSQ